MALFNLLTGLKKHTDHEWILLSNTLDNPLVKEYKKLGVEVICNKYLNRLMVYDRSAGMLTKLIKYGINAFRANLWFIRFSKQREADTIVYNDQRAASSFFLASFLLRHRIRIISIVRGTKDIKKIYNKISYALSSRIVSVSKSVHGGLPTSVRSKSVVIYDGISSKCKHQKPHADDGIMHLITVANIAHYKGLDLVIRALSEFPVNLQKTIKYHIVGAIKESSYMEELGRLFHSLNCQFKITYEGFQEDVYPFLARAHVFVLPSREEGFGLVLLEAMDCGLPLLGSKVGGIPEIILDDFNGYLFNAGDHKDLGQKLKIVVKDKKLRDRLSSNSKSRFAQFEAHETIQEYTKVLQ